MRSEAKVSCLEELDHATWQFEKQSGFAETHS